MTKPLKRFQLIKLKSQSTMKINLKYDRLPHFCFVCGLLCHSEKDCSAVTEDVQPEGYGWGLNIKASPRKGLSKNNEEVQALKSRKCFFVTKPKEAAIGMSGNFEGSKDLEADAVQIIASATAKNNDQDALISEENTPPVHVENNGGEVIFNGHANNEMAAQGTTNSFSLSLHEHSLAIDKDMNVLRVPTSNFVPTIENDLALSCTQAAGPCHINDIVDSNTGTTFLPSFDIGTSSPPLKKSLKSMKKRNGENIKIMTQIVERMEGSEQNVSSDSAGKRKFWVTDVVMEDTEVLMKKSCLMSDSDASS